MAVQREDSVVFLTTFFRWFGKFCSRSPVEILVIWLTIFACSLSLGLCNHSLMPTFRELDSNMVSTYTRKCTYNYIQYFCISFVLSAFFIEQMTVIYTNMKVQLTNRN